MIWTQRFKHYTGLLILSLILCVFVSAFVSHTIERAVLTDEQARSVRHIQKHVDRLLSTQNQQLLEPNTGTLTRLAELLGQELRDMQYASAHIYTLSGQMLWSTHAPDSVDTTNTAVAATPALRSAAGGKFTVNYRAGPGPAPPGTSAPADLQPGDGPRRWAELMIPLRFGAGPVLGVLAVTQPADREIALVRRAQLQTFLVVAAVFALLCAVFWRFVRTAARDSQQQAWEIHRQGLELRRRSMETFRVLAAAVEARDPYTSGHSERVAMVAARLGQAAGLSARQLAALKIAALMHDIGKIGVKERILEKPGPLTPDEYRQVQRHSEIGANLLSEIRPADPELTGWVRHHHERIDGNGYPDGLSGDDIPIGARIIAVADSYDAMRSWRPYRPAMSQQEASAELERARGRQLDDRLVKWVLGQLDAVELLYADAAAESSPMRLPLWAEYEAFADSQMPEPPDEEIMAHWAIRSGWRVPVAGAGLGLVIGVILSLLFHTVGPGAISWVVLLTLSIGTGWLFATIVQRMLDAAARDGLTGLMGCRQFHHVLDRAVARAAWAGEPVSLLYVDVDDFKIVNDHLGHATGDRVLTALAEALREGVRPTDVVARLGGDEFAVLMTGVGEEGARVAAARLEHKVADAVVALRPLLGNLEVRVSIGVAAFEALEDAQEFLNRADQDMYRGKRVLTAPASVDSFAGARTVTLSQPADRH